MSTFAFLLVCVHACLFQTVYSQCVAGPLGIGYGAGIAGQLAAPAYAAPGIGLGYGVAGLGYGAGLSNAGCGATYGGAGAGNAAVAGDLPVRGTTSVAGQVPIIGAIEYGGAVPAIGAVTISGTCACGCGQYGY